MEKLLSLFIANFFVNISYYSTTKNRAFTKSYVVIGMIRRKVLVKRVSENT